MDAQALAREVLRVVPVRLLACFQQQLDGVLGKGQEQRRQLVVLACRTARFRVCGDIYETLGHAWYLLGLIAVIRGFGITCHQMPCI